MTAYLGVEQSLTGRRWIGPDVETERLAQAIAQHCDLPTPVSSVLAERGVVPEDVATYLAPTLRDLLPDPRTLRDMESAADRLLAALKATQRIAIFADYDVDGAASAALLVWWLRAQGKAATVYVPDRIDEGYGPNKPAMQRLAEGHDLIICVDCGTLSHDALESTQDADIVVIDHHLGAESVPAVHAVVNPNRQDEDGALAHLCAAAVVFLVLVEANRRLKSQTRPAPDLIGMLDLVGLATVADVAPLIGVNRAFVRQGLAIMARRERPGIKALTDIARLKEPPNTYHLGYVLGPRINAGGRVGRADLGARLLSTDDPDEAMALAEKLDALNDERRTVENEVRSAAFAQVEARNADPALSWAAGDGWHPGVVGIVAARLKETTNRPSVVIGFDGDLGKGSGRSVSGIDLGASVQRLAAEGLIERGGGHRMAAGLTLDRTQLVPAMERLSELLARQSSAPLGAPDLRVSGTLMPPAATTDLIADLERVGPFGMASPSPRFVFPDQRILSARRVGESHLKLRVGDGVTAPLDVIAFGAFESPLGPALEARDGTRFHLTGRLGLNRWDGRETVQLTLEDAAVS